MEEQETQWRRIKARSPAWVLSLAGHLLLLGIFAMITWMVVEAAPRDRDLTLAPEEQLQPPGEEGTAEESGSMPGAPADAERKEQAESAVLPAAAPPVPALDALTPQLIEPTPASVLLVGKTDPTDSLIESLAGVGELKGLGRGTGGLPGTGLGFGGLLRGLRQKGLDVVLVLDATDSMAPYIEQAKRRLQQVITVVTLPQMVPNARFGVVAYKDYGDEYIPDAVKFLRITDDHKAVRRFLDDIVAGGGGDEPEPIDEALTVVTDPKKMGWGGGRKWVVILAGDSSIHASGRKVAFERARMFAHTLRGTINVIDVGGAGEQDRARRSVQPDLKRIAQAGGGEAFLLTEREAFWRHLIVSVFGHSYEQDVLTIIKMFAKED